MPRGRFDVEILRSCIPTNAKAFSEAHTNYADCKT